jgi:hypothetical protein
MKMARIRTVSFVTFPTGEIVIRFDDIEPAGDDTLNLDVAMYDDAGGLYFLTADADRLAEFMAQREPASVPGGRP